MDVEKKIWPVVVRVFDMLTPYTFRRMYNQWSQKLPIQKDYYYQALV